MPTYNTLQDVIAHLGEYRDQLITKAKFGKVVAGPHPNWGQAETLSYNAMPFNTAATVARHLDHAQDYIGQDEFGAAAYHIMLAVGKMAA